MTVRFGFLLFTYLVYSAACSTKGEVFQEEAGTGAEGDAGAEADGPSAAMDAATKPDVGPADVAVTADVARDSATVAPDVAASVDAAKKLDTAVAAPDAAPTMVPLPLHPSCTFGRQTVRQLSPELILLLDRSGSMNTLVPMTKYSRWDSVNMALDVVLRNTTNQVYWGLKLFPAVGMGCDVPEGIEVNPAIGNVDAMFRTIHMSLPSAAPPGTPLGQGVRAATRYLTSLHIRNPEFLVVATDGQPTCPDVTQGGKDSVAALQDAAKSGISTFVLGVAEAGTAESQVLSDLATAGGVPSDGATKYFSASTQNNLLAVLEGITKRITKCVFVLDVAPPSPKDVGVYVDGRRLGAQDWVYSGNNLSVEIKGATCEQLKAGTASRVEMILGCPGVPVP